MRKLSMDLPVILDSSLSRGEWEIRSGTDGEPEMLLRAAREEGEGIRAFLAEETALSSRCYHLALLLERARAFTIHLTGCPLLRLSPLDIGVECTCGFVQLLNELDEAIEVEKKRHGKKEEDGP